jgi:flavin reductase (DIM6/NTAB) family NADH-FMN oxidoreductase RutF
MDQKALFRIEYGLYLATTRDGDKDNGAILNSVAQVTNSPARVAVTVNKQGLTCELIAKTGKLNLCPLTEKTPFSVFQKFGMQSGRTADKFEGEQVFRTDNGLYFSPVYATAVISLSVAQSIDLGTHTMFICDVEDAMVLSDDATMTYSYYHAKVKEKPQQKRGYVCRICGYVYEGDPLPADFICPLCGHGAEDFEPRL